MKKGKRLIAMVLAMTVALGSVYWKPPEAKAVFVEPAAALGCALLVSAIVGTTANLVFTDVVKEDIGNAIDPLVCDFLDYSGAALSNANEFYSAISTGLSPLAGGVLALSDEAGSLIARFINWLQTEKGFEAGGENMPVFSDSGFRLTDGTLASLSTDIPYTSGWYKDTTFNGTLFPIGTDVEFMSGARISFTDDGTNSFVVTLYGSDGTRLAYSGSYSGNGFVTLYINGAGYLGYAIIESVPSDTIEQYWCFVDTKKSPDLFSSVSDEAFILQPLPEFQEIPQELPEGQVFKIDTGIESLSVNEPHAAVDAIFDATLAGTLAPTVSVEDAATDVPATDIETDTSILSWVKQIWQTITDIPGAIAEAVVGIFVPSADFYPTAIADLKDAFSDRMGLLTYPISILFDFLDRVVNLSDQQPILTWGNIYLPGYATPLVAAGQYNLNDAIGTSQGKSLHDIYLVIVDAIMILAFVDLCRHKYQKIIHN